MCGAGVFLILGATTNCLDVYNLIRESFYSQLILNSDSKKKPLPHRNYEGFFFVFFVFIRILFAFAISLLLYAIYPAQLIQNNKNSNVSAHSN